MKKKVDTRLSLALALFLGLASSGAAQDSELGRAWTLAQADASAAKKSRAEAAKPGPLVRFVIFHTNDIHGAIAPVPADPAKSLPALGGAASLATLIKGEALPHVWIDAGDWFQGTPEGNFSKGQAIVEIFNALHLTAGLLGNHDFDYGEGNAKSLAAAATFPVLGSNILSAASGQPVGYVKSTLIVEPVPGIKVGIFGLLTEGMADLSFEEHIKGMGFGGYEKTAAAAVRKLRSQGAGIIVAATHVGIEKYGEKTYDGITLGDIFIAEHVPGIDLILGGHTHTPMDKPVIVVSEGRKTMITQTGGYLKAVYRIEVAADAKTGRLKEADGNLVALDPAVYPPDTETAKLVAADQAMVAKEMARPLGSATAEITRKPTPAGESAMGDWFTDVLRRYGKTDIATVNTFGLRGDLPAGPLKYGDAYKVMPFDNKIVKLDISGAELYRLVEKNLGAGGIALQFSGLEISYDPKAEDGHRLQSLTIGGAAVVPTQPYTLTTFDFTANVDKSFKGIQKKSIEKPAILARDVLVAEITEHSPVSASIDGRVRIPTP